jgi:hypothetical protein
MNLDQKLIEAIVMSATAGQFGAQLISETFSRSFEKLDEAKRQFYMHMLSGTTAIVIYVLTNESFVAKAGMVAFLSGMFAEAALKLLKKKNVEKSQALAAKVHLIEKKELESKVEYLEKELVNKAELLIDIQKQRDLEKEEPLQTR